MPADTIMISDDEHDPQETLSREMKVLGENIDKINETVKELGIEVATYAKLLDAAQKRLEKAREQKEQFVDKKHRLLNKKQKLMQSDLIARGSTSKPGPVMQVRSAVAEVAELDSVMEALSPYPSHSHSILTSSPLPLHENQLPALPLPLASMTSGDGGGSEPEPEPEPKLEPESKPLRRFGQFSIAGQSSPRATKRRGRGLGSRRSYGGLSGVRLEASRGGRGVAARTHAYGPYYEASDSDPEASLSRNQPNVRLATPQTPRNIPVNPQTFSRKQISSIIGGKTQGTWCSINPNKATIYNAGPYMALVRDLNHLLPQQPGENGGVYVGDWLRREVGKTYQVFIKRSQNHWLYYGKYLVSSIREVSRAEWAVFQGADKDRWAEHMLEHRWGKEILQKKNLMTKAECVKPNWRKVLSFFNQADNLPKLRLKLLSLHFLSYDRGLYNAIVSASLVRPKPSPAGNNKGKRPHSDDDEEEEYEGEESGDNWE